MPLKKAIIDPNSGAVATYWFITKFAVDARTSECRIRLDGFAEPEYREREEGIPLITFNYSMEREDFLRLAGAAPAANTVYGVVAKPMYQWIKTVPLIVPGRPPQPPMFADAEDI